MFQKTCVFIVSAIMCFLIFPAAPYAQDPYVTVDEMNRRAQEEMMKMAEEMKAMNQGTYKPRQMENIDYSTYGYVVDFKNVFGGWGNAGGGNAYDDFDSIWQNKERQRHREYLADKRFDYIVLPVEDFSKRHDPTSKLLSAKYIADSLSRVSGELVMDPELFLKAYSERSEFFNNARFYEITPMQKYRIVHLFLKLRNNGYVNDEKESNYELAVVVSDNTGKIETFKIFALDKETDFSPLELKVRKIAGNIVEVITTKDVNVQMADQPPVETAGWRLEGAFSSLLARRSSTIDQAAYLQLLAMLTPQDFSMERAHLFERSLCLLDGTADSELTTLLRARSMHYLHRRPLAMELLQRVERAELVALKEYLNGNYYALRDAVAQISSPLLYTLAFIELNQMARAYGKDLPKYDTTMADPAWSELVDRRAKEDTPWYMEEDDRLLASMVSLLPSVKPMLQEVYDSIDLSETDVQFVSLLTQRILNVADAAYGGAVRMADIVQLYRNIICSNLIRQLNRTVYLQGRYELGVDFAEKGAALLQGLPAFSYLHAKGLYYRALKKPANMRSYDYEQADSIACVGAKNSFPFQEINASLWRLLGDIHKVHHVKDGTCNGMAMVHYFPSEEKGSKYDVFSYEAFRNELKGKDLVDAERQKILGERFDGHPQKMLDHAAELRRISGRKAAIAYLEKMIQDEVQPLSIYIQLGDYHMEEGQFADASRAYFSYQSFFTIPSGERVSLSNLGYELGERFFSIGRIDEALRFFSFSESLHTGSQEQKLASYEMAVVRGAYEKAAEIAYNTWEHYRSGEDLGKYLVMNDLLETGVDVSPQLLQQLKNQAPSSSYGRNMPMWRALRFHDRMNGRELSDTLATLANIKKTQQHGPFKREVDLETLMSAMIDQRMDEGVHLQLSNFTSSHLLVPQTTDLWKSFVICYPELRERVEDDHQQMERVVTAPKNESADLYLAFMYMQKQKYDEALLLFLKFDQRSGGLLKDTRMARFILPYFLITFCQSSTFDADLLSEILTMRASSRELKFDSVDDYLVSAISLASENKVDQAVEVFSHSHQMLYDIYTGEWESCWYQLFQTGEWLSLKTKDARFIASVLDWAQRLQTIAPYLAWPHAFAALYGRNEEQRRNDAAIAMHLDPASNWLSMVPEKFKEGAEQRWKEIRSTIGNGPQAAQGLLEQQI